MNRRIAGCRAKSRRRRLWYKVVSALACVVVFCTTYALILPALTMETGRVLNCPLELHAHTADCYDGAQLVCGLADYVVHTHDDSCYDADGALVCALPEIEEHAHTDACYTEEAVLVCGETESAGHEHTDACYQQIDALTCGKEESTGHEHAEGCYAPARGALTCEETEHTHTDACYEQIDVLACEQEPGEGAHTHDESCYGAAPLLACELEEGAGGHTHTDDCYKYETVLSCGREEVALHAHDSACYDAGGALTCGRLAVSEHTHTGDCFTYAAEGVPAALSAGEADHEADHFDLTYNGNTITFYLVDANGRPLTAEVADIAAESATKYIFENIKPKIEGYQYVGAKYDNKAVVSVATSGYNNSFSEKFRFYIYEPIQSRQWYTRDDNAEVTLTYALSELDGMSFAIVNGDCAMTAGSTTVNGVSGLAFQNVTVSGNRIVGDATEWTFEKQEGGTYHISTTVDGKKQYLYLCATSHSDGGGKGSLTLNDEPQEITVEILDDGSVALTREKSVVNRDDPSNNFWCYNDVTALGDRSRMRLVLVGKPDTVEGITPKGTVINLFDYWVVKEDEGADDFNYDDDQFGSGINADHVLKFSSSNDDPLGTANRWTGTSSGNKGVLQGIVDKNLGEDGYPVLSGKLQNGSSDEESLAHLFDPTQDIESRSVYRNVGGLLQEDTEGYYYYDSTQNYAYYDKNDESTGKRFTLYDECAVQFGNDTGMFFPFDDYPGQAVKADTSGLNHFFGLTLTSRFVHRYGGHTNSNRKTSTIFEFSGDDDVWIFIDGVLVADLGGIHDKAHVMIDFAEGTVTIDNVYESGKAAPNQKVTSFQSIFANTGVALAGDTFEDNSYHTLKFFYMERGGSASNLMLKYNLSAYPPTGISKVNQYGEAVAGAEFQVYRADKNYDIETDSNPVYSGTTDVSGEMVFVDEDGMPYTMAELKNLFGEYFVLKETSAPDGYRLVSDEIHLHIDGNVMKCENTRESGVWADATLQVSAPNVVLLVNGGEQTIVDDQGDENGTLFAVVLKYIGERAENGDATALEKEASWAPVYGTSETGYTVVNVGSGSFISAVIDTAQRYVESDQVFHLAANGAMTGGLNGLPGDIATYYYMLPEDEKAKTQYTVAYYWTEADSLESATKDDTFRVDADGTKEETEQYRFDRVFGATINVPNLLNKMVVQKLDEDGTTLVNGATFALYKVKEEENGIYYVADDNNTRIHLEKDTDGDNEGTAWLQGGSAEDGGSYTVDPGTGKITVTIDGQTYTISPAKGGDGESMVTTTVDAAHNELREDGSAAFSYMLTGTYYMREVSAPKGYDLNPAEVMVLVTDNAIYVNAGTADDGVTVARGPGYLAASMQQYASIGDIDNTLSWMYTQMKISNVSTEFGDVNSEAYYGAWQYIAKQHVQNFESETVASTSAAQNATDPLTVFLQYDPESKLALFNYKLAQETQRNEISTNASAGNRRLYTDIGWSYLEIYQNYPYGEGASAERGANYENWWQTEEGSYVDLSHLFSRSLYVQVTNERGGRLEISKAVKNAPLSVLDDAEFTFTVSLTDEKEEPLMSDYPYYLYTVGADGKRSPVIEDDHAVTGTIKNGGTITLKDKQLAMIVGLPEGTQYTVTETKLADGITTTAVRDKGKALINNDETAGEKSFDSDTVKGTLYWLEEENKKPDKTSTVDFTNTYPGLALQKIEAGNSGKVLKGAQFVLYKTGENGETLYYNPHTSEFVELSDGFTEQAAVLESGEDGRISLGELADGAYTLEEVKAPDGYQRLTETIPIFVEGNVFKDSYPNGSGVSISEDKQTLIVSNSTGYELPQTGGAGTAPFAIGGALLMAGSLWGGYSLRRKTGRRPR